MTLLPGKFIRVSGRWFKISTSVTVRNTVWVRIYPRKRPLWVAINNETEIRDSSGAEVAR